MANYEIALHVGLLFNYLACVRVKIRESELLRTDYDLRRWSCPSGVMKEVQMGMGGRLNYREIRNYRRGR